VIIDFMSDYGIFIFAFALIGSWLYIKNDMLKTRNKTNETIKTALGELNIISGDKRYFSRVCVSCFNSLKHIFWPVMLMYFVIAAVGGSWVGLAMSGLIAAHLVQEQIESPRNSGQ